MNHLPCAFLKQATLCSSTAPPICQAKMFFLILLLFMVLSECFTGAGS